MRDTREYGVAMPGKDSPAPGALAVLIRNRRAQRGLTQDQVAEESGVGRSTVIRWENGQTTPSREQLLKVCSFLGIRTEEALQAAGWPVNAPRTREQVIAELMSMLEPDERARLQDALDLIELRRQRPNRA